MDRLVESDRIRQGPQPVSSAPLVDLNQPFAASRAHHRLGRMGEEVVREHSGRTMAFHPQARSPRAIRSIQCQGALSVQHLAPVRSRFHCAAPGREEFRSE